MDNELWKQVRADYLATGASYPELAERHGVSISTLKKRAMREKWAEDYDEVLLASQEPAAEEMEPGEEMEPAKMEPQPKMEPRPKKEPRSKKPKEEISFAPTDGMIIDERRNRVQKFFRITDAMMDRIEEALMDPDVRNPYALKHLASALRDLREMQGLNRSALDIEEQKARIAKIKSETARYEVNEEEAGGIIFLPMTEGKLVPPDE